MNLFHSINKLFDFWITTDWYIAIMMSFVVNLIVYLSVSAGIFLFTRKMDSAKATGSFIATEPLKKGQLSKEIKYGTISCFIFAVASLFTRELFEGIWPQSVVGLLVEIMVFAIFYETYSYFIHRLLHLKPFLRIHAVHHYSRRVTPWSSYSVHPFEAVMIGLSAPLFMLMFPMHLAVILILHVLGMSFTILIHSNFVLNENIVLSKVFNGYTEYHALHHAKVKTNFGFINRFWDTVFKTHG